MLTPKLPRLPLRVTPTAAGYDLMLDDPDQPGPVRIATVHDDGAHFGPGAAGSFAHCLAAALLMVHCLDDLIEYAQPEVWSDAEDAEQANIWRAVFRAFCFAQDMPRGARMMVDVVAAARGPQT